MGVTKNPSHNLEKAYIKHADRKKTTASSLKVA
jgi:hypothetical protein